MEEEERIATALERMASTRTLRSVLLACLFFATILFISPGRVIAEECSKASALMSKGVSASSKETKTDYYRRVLSLCPSLVEANYNLGIALLADGRYEEAEQLLQKADDLSPSIEIDLAMARVLLEKGDLTAADSLYHDIIAQRPTEAKAFEGLGVLQSIKGNFQASEDSFETALKLDPRSDVALHNLGILQERRGEREKAKQSYQKALEINPNNALFYLSRATLEQGEKQRAILEKARAIAPEDRSVGLALAKYHRNKGDYQRATQDYQRLTELFPEDSSLTVELARIKFESGAQEQAITLLERSLSTRPNDANLLNILGWMYLEQSRITHAITTLQDAIALNSEDPFSYNALGLAYERNSENEKARENYGRALELKPDLLEAKENLKRVSKLVDRDLE